MLDNGSSQNQLSTQHLLKLFSQKKLKDTKIYLQQIQKFNPKVQKVISDALYQSLVKYNTSLDCIISAINFYKQLLLHSQFETLQSQAFSEQIHKSIAKVCKYNPNDPYKDRGRKYFISNIVKVQKTRQNQSIGCAYVGLALQIIKKIAQWYPIDYMTLQESRYKIYYDTLMKKGVIFPKQQQIRYMGEKQRKKFQKNLAKWKKKIDQLEQEIEHEQEIKSKIKQSQIKTPIVSSKADDNKQITKVQKNAFRNQQKQQNNNKINQAQQQKIQYYKTKLSQNNIMKQTKLIQGQNKQKQTIKKGLKAQTPKSIKKQGKKLQKIEYFQKINKIQQSPITKLSTHQNQGESNQKTLLSQLNQVINNNTNANNNNVNTNNINTINTNNTYKQPQNAQIQNIKKLTASENKTQNIPEIQKSDKKQQNKLNKRKIMKTQHYQPKYSSVEINNRKDPFKTIQSIKTQKQFSRKHSMRKIERKIYSDNLKTIDIAQQSYQIKTQKQQTGLKAKTLSYYRLQKKRVQQKIDPILLKQMGAVKHKGLQMDPILLYLGKLKLNPIIVPIFNQYFLPISHTMYDLLQQSLKLCDHPSKQASKPFFRDHNISARVIKNRLFYILSIQNIGLSELQICYSRKLQSIYNNQFGQEIQIIVNRPIRDNQALTWTANPNQYIDIKIKFKTNNPNFKFLSLALLINNTLKLINMPITLLDQGQILTQLDLGQITKLSKLNARMIKSQPFTIQALKKNKLNIFKQNIMRTSFLPIFFGKPRYQQHIMGRMTYRIRIQHDHEINIGIMIMRNKNYECQITAIYNSQQQLNEDYGKVLVELVGFLLKNTINSPL